MEYRIVDREPRVGDMVRVVDFDDEYDGKVGRMELIDLEVAPSYKVSLNGEEIWLYRDEFQVIEPIESTSKEEKSKVKNQRTYTTPEIIATLKVGQRATNTDHGTITKDKYGGIVRSNGEYLHLNPYIMKAEWTIVPEYVDFMTAFRAWREGKRIMCGERVWGEDDCEFGADYIDSNEWIILDDGE